MNQSNGKDGQLYTTLAFDQIRMLKRLYGFQFGSMLTLAYLKNINGICPSGSLFLGYNIRIKLDMP